MPKSQPCICKLIVSEKGAVDPPGNSGYYFFNQTWHIYSVRNSLPSNGGPIGPLGSEVQWPLLKLDGPKLFKYFFLTNCLFNLLKVTRQKDTKVIYVKFLYFKLEYKLYLV